jgi:hypothetical protein
MNTLYDLVARILDARDGSNDPVSERRALRAAIWGADQVTQKHAWSDYHTESIHAMNAPVDAVVSISPDGLLTIASGTLPDWMGEASVAFGNRLHIVGRRVNNTTATLENYHGTELLGQAITIVHDRLLIQDDVRQIYAVRNEREDTELLFAGASAFHLHQLRNNAVPGEPSFVTAARSGQPGQRRTELRLSPSPSSDITLRVSYYRISRKATVLHDCGTVSIDSDDLSAVTIDKPLKVSDLFDLVLVLSGNQHRPDAEMGFSVVDDNPSIADLTVKSIETPTKLRLMDTYQEIDGRGGILTQRLDLPPHACEAAAMYGEAKYLQIGNGSHGDFWQTIQMADAELRTAMEQESVLAPQSLCGPRVAIYTRPEKLVGVNP